MPDLILIGGASLAGKSRLAAALAERLGWEVVATDYLARHPGRPWRDDGSEVPPHVVEHFLTLSPQDLLEDVLRHYRSLSPQILGIAGAIGQEEGALPPPCPSPKGEGAMTRHPKIIEGSAVLPELMVRVPDALACLLVAQPGVLTRRIQRAAGPHNEAAAKFAARAELMNACIASEATRLGLAVCDAEGDCIEEVMLRSSG